MGSLCGAQPLTAEEVSVALGTALAVTGCQGPWAEEAGSEQGEETLHHPFFGRVAWDEPSNSVINPPAYDLSSRLLGIHTNALIFFFFFFF